jgi:hypothetical protein
MTFYREDMTAALIKERYYILTPLSFLLGGLVLIATLLLAAASYLSSIDKTVAGYGHMLAALDATCSRTWRRTTAASLAYWRRPWTSRPSLPGHRPSIPSGPLPISSSTTPTSSISNARTHRLDGYPDWQQPEGYRAQARPWYQTLSGEGDDLVWFGPYPRSIRSGRY